MLEKFGSTSYWVVAEIAKINEKGGHYYLELVDSEDNRTSALFSANIWSSTYGQIFNKIGPDLLQILKPGNKVLFSVRIDYHRIYGLKLNVLGIDPSYSYGEVEKRKQETILKLKEEGLYDLQSQLYLPVIAKRIALIGSSGTAGYRDFLNKLTSNEVYRNFKIKEFQASVQGDKAAAELITALKEARLYDVEVIVIVRGGGSKMDLNVFNDYDLNREICLTKIPVITGVGHEYDEVVADLICNKMCITPTAAAEFLYNQIGIFSAQMRSAYDAIINRSREQLSGLKDEFYHLHKYLIHNSKQFLIEYQWQLKEDSHRMQKLFLHVLNAESGRIDLLKDKVKSQSLNRLHLAQTAELPAKLDKLEMLLTSFIDQKKVELNGVEEMLNMLNPVRLLKSGYTISTIDDIDVNKINDDLEGKTMKTLTSNALISSEIKSVKKN
ncbi:exodeoxyribonuclease VII large subunit [Paracrocinitomix mangrovi]|nr:exodeoxyribonuclease VII large subunit [Paracrocinitomix mangrovi]